MLMSLLCAGPWAWGATEPLATSRDSTRHSVVFVIDVSTSMYDIIDDLKAALKDYVKEATPGQSVAIVTFGRNANLLFRKTIRGDRDIEKMVKFCDEMCCSDENTYIPCGVYKGLSELYAFYRANPGGLHTLVLMSDGKNNPPKGLEDVITYESIKDSFFRTFEPGKDWYISYVSLRGAPDVELKDFVEECRGNTMELGKDKGTGKLNVVEFGKGTEEQNLKGLRSFMISEVLLEPGRGLKLDKNNVIVLGSALLPLKTSIPVMIRPLRGEPWGQRIRVEPVLTNIGTDTRVIADVRPSEFACPESSKEESITLSIDGAWNKAINGVLWFKPVAGTILVVTPAQLEFRFDESVKLIAHAGYYKPELDGSKWESISRFAIGPLAAGQKASETLILKLEGTIPPEGLNIEAVPSISLPQGITCTASCDAKSGLFKGSEAHIFVTVEADGNADIQGGKIWDGELVLTSSIAALAFSQNPMPLRIFGPAAQLNGTWRGRMRSYSRELHPWQWAKENWRWIGLASGAVALPVLLLVVVGYVRWKAYSRKFVAAEGWLIVLEKPLEFAQGNVDLRELSEKLKKSKLTVGSDAASEIPISHESIRKRHAQVRSGREGTPTPVYIKSLELSDIKVNNFPLDDEIKLNDGDIIEIGAFQFIYSNTQLKQVVVHYKDGAVRYGVPLTWNIEEDGFVLQPEGGGADELQVYVHFKELKGVFFVKHFDKEIGSKMKLGKMFHEKDHILIECKDGEKIEGYTVRVYDAGAPRFFVVPKVEEGKEENNICILIEREFTKKVELLSTVA